MANVRLMGCVIPMLDKFAVIPECPEALKASEWNVGLSSAMLCLSYMVLILLNSWVRHLGEAARHLREGAARHLKMHLREGVVKCLREGIVRHLDEEFARRLTKGVGCLEQDIVRNLKSCTNGGLRSDVVRPQKMGQ